jgi:hypothetical protein
LCWIYLPADNIHTEDSGVPNYRWPEVGTKKNCGKTSNLNPLRNATHKPKRPQDPCRPPPAVPLPRF